MVAMMENETVIVELFNSGEIVHELTEHICRSLSEADANAFRATCGDLAQQGNLLDLVTEFFNKLSADFSGGEETIKVFSILFSLMRHLDPDTLALVVVKLCAEISNSTEHAATRFYILKDVYCILAGNSSARFSAFVSCLEYSIKTDQEDKMAKDLSVDDAKKMCKKMNVSKSDERNLYLIMCDALYKLKASDPSIKDSGFLLAYLNTYEEETPEVLSTVSEYAARAAAEFIKKPFSVEIYKMNKSKLSYANRSGGVTAAYHLRAVQYLKNSSSSLHKGAFALLDIFCSGSLDKFNAFCAENGEIFQSLNLDKEECTHNMKLLALASLASENDSVDYATIASTLQIDADAVERWVVTGIERQLIDAKLDQVRQKIIMNRGSERLFTENHWMQLDSKLKNWTNSVQSVLSTVRQAKIEHSKLARYR